VIGRCSFLLFLLFLVAATACTLSILAVVILILILILLAAIFILIFVRWVPLELFGAVRASLLSCLGCPGLAWWVHVDTFFSKPEEEVGGHFERPVLDSSHAAAGVVDCSAAILGRGSNAGAGAVVLDGKLLNPLDLVDVEGAHASLL
jgi:hypothetical protein